MYNPKLNKTYRHDVKRAKQLLKEAGVAPGTTIKAVVPNSAPQSTIAEIVQADLEEVGLTLDYTVSQNIVDDVARLKPDMVFVGMEPTLWPIAFSGSVNALNPCGWSSPQASADLVTMQDGSKSNAEKQAAADSFQKLLLDESPVVVSVLNPATSASTTKVKGIDVLSARYGPNLATAYMTK